MRTPHLWKDVQLNGIKQYKIDFCSFQFLPISTKLRLGMFVEQCIFQAIENDVVNKILVKNLQIIDQNITLGEIDCILKHQKSIIHLEIAYKFYLFDPDHAVNELNCWIGPNRKDSLVDKIEKLSKKQFPLLSHPKTMEKLNELNLNLQEIQQQVCFKAQLFVPVGYTKDQFEIVNEDCIVGMYYTHAQLLELVDTQYYIPSKLEWTALPYSGVNWLNKERFLKAISLFLSEEKSPMFWIKNKKGIISKCFAVWW